MKQFFILLRTRIVIVLNLLFICTILLNGQTIVWQENFEEGFGDWWSDNGIWQFGETTSSPGSAYEGTQTAATITDGNYPYGPDSRLISPGIQLPEISNSQEILIRYHQYFSYSSSDKGEVQISEYDKSTKSWSSWSTLKTNTSWIPDWHHERIDLTAYSGKKIRIGFMHTDNTEKDRFGNNVHIENQGWYIDQLSITKQDIQFINNPEYFESDWNGWHSSNGIWELGTPTTWTNSAYEGLSCIGTVLSGKYPYGPDSRIISPNIKLPEISGDAELLLRYYQIFSYSSSDKGEVQISEYDKSTKSWNSWSTLKTNTSWIPDWHHERIDLTAYSGKKIRIGFMHTDNTEKDRFGNNVHIENQGWYIDEILINGLPTAVSHSPKTTGGTILQQNTPNPFNSSTSISYSLYKTGLVRLELYDCSGVKLKSLVNAVQTAVEYKVTLDANDLPNGIYFYSLRVGNKLVGTKKMVVVK